MPTLFEINRRRMGDAISRVFPPNYVTLGTGAIVAARGIAVGAASLANQDGNGNVGDYASGTNFLGFLTRDVKDGGPTLADIAIPNDPLGLPHTAGLECALEMADEVEAEGTGYLLTSGTGALTSSTAVGTKISFAPDGSGRFYAAQANDLTWFTLEAVITDSARLVNAGALRMRFTSPR